MALIFCSYSPADAGWLGDKLKQAAENVGDKLIDDASDSAYEGAKDAVSPENDEDSEAAGRYDSEGSEEYEQQDDDSAEYGAEYELEKMGQPSWVESGYEQKPRKRKKTGPPRTDLHLTADMIISDPASSPEPFKGKMYLDGARSRSEFVYPGGNNVGVIVTGIDPADKVYILMHSEKKYMETTVEKQDDAPLSFESSKPCEGFRKAEDLGRTKLNGRSVAKWRCSEPEDPEMYEEAEGDLLVWIDDKLKIPVRFEEGKGHWELLNIREGKPSGDLFKIPAGYEKLAYDGFVIPAAASLPDQDAKLIKSAGIPLYSKADFVYGNSSVGFRFASSEPVETVKTWYRKQLPSWPVYNEYGGWILYNGKAGSGMGEIMAKPQVSVQENEKLPEWHDLDKKMTTEIVIMVPQ
ncbi:MAG: hypothetical protein AMJ60_11000 [Desulfobacterales bacterium SG8_35]|nr:MAG: hypothetical protein AMJ60_11000 [Desulfobacterales bacterium SG8_35]